jgi:hypothetical protein
MTAITTATPTAAIAENRFTFSNKKGGPLAALLHFPWFLSELSSLCSLSSL